ncbi:MAG TPA: 5'-deoxyadenosine deaminase [Vicinamibacterales bacterium]|nr:5'-deoxyadenosine deaminase [Vicinamibacterales bacterium]
MAPAPLLVRRACVLTMNDAFDIIEGDVLIEDGRIRSVGGTIVPPPGAMMIDAAGDYLLPGFVQTHIHLCQTLFRGYADDRALLDWLRTRILPMEAAHTPASLRAATGLAAAELLQGGTTSVLTMETVHDTDAVFEALEPTGLRAVVGKCMMDADPAAPSRLREQTQASIDESLAIARRWHGRAGGRLRAALAPRFAVSCSRDLLEAVAQLSRTHGLLVHTHASENRDEVALVRQRTGLANIAYLAELGLVDQHVCLAHCVWVDEGERRLLAERRAHVLHCPGSNLKLGSGIAPVVELRQLGVSLSLGADGAACNNHLDMFQEMRLAATLQAVRSGPGTLPAREVVAIATRGGAYALGLAQEIGQVTTGFRADLILVRSDRPHQTPAPDPYATLVYATQPTDVRTAIVDGELLVHEGTLTRWETGELVSRARAEAKALAVRAFG